MNCAINVAKTKVLIRFMVTAKLNSVFVFAYANCWFSDAVAHIKLNIQFLISSFKNGALQ